MPSSGLTTVNTVVKVSLTSLQGSHDVGVEPGLVPDPDVVDLALVHLLLLHKGALSRNLSTWPFGLKNHLSFFYTLMPKGYFCTSVQSWALEVFLNLFNNEKGFFAFFIKLI